MPTEWPDEIHPIPIPDRSRPPWLTQLWISGAMFLLVFAGLLAVGTLLAGHPGAALAFGVAMFGSALLLLTGLLHADRTTNNQGRNHP